MEIVNIRIDERLIHGQVAAVWTRTLGANRIMVIDHAAVNSDIQKSALKMACPQNCKLSVLSVGKACENLKNKKYEGEKIFIVVKSPETLKELYDAGYEFPKVTVGNMAKKAGARQVKDTVYITEQNEQDFKYLAHEGVVFDACMVPSDPVFDFIKLL